MTFDNFKISNKNSEELEKLINTKNNLIKKNISEISKIITSIKENYYNLDNDIFTGVEFICDQLSLYVKNVNELSLDKILENYKSFDFILKLINLLEQECDFIHEKTELSVEFKSYDDKYIKLFKEVIYKFKKEIGLIYTKFASVIVIILYDFITDESKLNYIVEKIKKYEVWTLYISLFRKLYTFLQSTELKEQDDELPKITNSILMQINEDMKSFILNTDFYLEKNLELKKSLNTLNPPLSTHGLTPITNVLNIEEVAKLLNFNIKTFADFITKCKKNKINILIKKAILNNCVGYKIIDLLDYNISKKYESNNSLNDGITPELIKRFDIITYFNKQNKKIFDVDYKIYEHNGNKTIILQEIAPELYQILTNNFDIVFPEYFVSNDIFDAIKPKISTRIDNYNNLFNEEIEKNMFLGVLPNMQTIKNRADEVIRVEPIYLKNTIKNLILEEYEKLYKNIKNVQDYSKIIYAPSFLNIFSTTIINTYKEYLDNAKITNLNEDFKSEIYTSFIYNLSMYERDFIKKMHDNFINEIQNVIEIFNEQNIKTKLELIFKQILEDTLSFIINNENNIYMSINYKLQLLLVN
jgi:hypothetical protein